MSRVFNIKDGIAGHIFSTLLKEIEGTPCAGANDFVLEVWKVYQDDHDQKPSITGKVFEYLIAHVLYSFDVAPLYYQARFHFVPNADFDFVLYDPRRPIVLTLKTTLRERYKQADLEGLALKQVYRNASCILITLSNEGDQVARKIKSLDVTGLDRVVVIKKGSRDLDDLIRDIKTRPFSKPKSINPMMGQLVMFEDSIV